MSPDDDDRGGRRKARRMWRVVKASLFFMVAAVFLDHLAFGDRHVTHELSDLEKRRESGSFGAVFRAEHAVEHAIEHTLHDIGAGIDHVAHTHVFHHDDDELPSRRPRHIGDGDGQASGGDVHDDGTMSSAAHEQRGDEGGGWEGGGGDVGDQTRRRRRADEPAVEMTEEMTERGGEGAIAAEQDTGHMGLREEEDGRRDASVRFREAPTTPTLSSSKSKWPVQLGSMTRKQAQRAVLNVLAGKTRMLPDKTPVQSFTWDAPVAPPRATQCRDSQKEGTVVHVGDIFKNNVKDGVGYSHMAMISQMPGPNPVWKWIVVWQCSPGIEGTSNMHLRAAFSDDLKTWTPSVEVNVKKESPPKAIWAPVLHLHRATKPGEHDTLWLFFSESTKCLRTFSDMPPRWSPGGDIRAVSSIDGFSWSKPKTLITGPEEGGNPKVIANKLAVTKTGAWVLPYWGEVSSARGCHTSQSTVSGVLISKDRGHTWKPTGKVHPRGGRIIEGTVTATSSGSILQMWRSRQGVLLQSTSKDGHGWPQPHKSDRKNPDAKPSITTLHGSHLAADGHVALAYNDETRGRGKLTVALSADEGHHWKNIAVVEPGRNGVHFHYPTIDQDGCRAVVVYSYMRRQPWPHALKISRTAPFGGIKVALIALGQKKEPTVAQGLPSDDKSDELKRSNHEDDNDLDGHSVHEEDGADRTAEGHVDHEPHGIGGFLNHLFGGGSGHHEHREEVHSEEGEHGSGEADQPASSDGGEQVRLHAQGGGATASSTRG